MFRRVQNKKQYFNLGFTLVELLVVIAIIGILSSVAVVNLNSAREKARASAVLASFVELNSAVRLCMDDEKPIKCTSADSPDGDCGQVTSELAPGTIICAGSSNAWPDLASKYSPWEYNSNFIFDTEDQTYTIGAAMIDDSDSVTCTELGCGSLSGGGETAASCNGFSRPFCPDITGPQGVEDGVVDFEDMIYLAMGSGSCADDPDSWFEPYYKGDFNNDCCIDSVDSDCFSSYYGTSVDCATFTGTCPN